MIDLILSQAPLYLLVAARCLGLIMTVPLLSTQAVPRAAKFALAGCIAFLVLPSAYNQYQNSIESTYGAFSLEYVLLLVGEALIGVITGFYVTIIFAAFSTAGQFFTFQMGLSASEVYDAVSQIENPVMGQFLNLIAMLIFLQVKAFQQLFMGGILRSFQSISAFTLVTQKEAFVQFMLSGLSKLFVDAMMIALPIVGTLFLITVTMGILSKAAPQMNLLSEGFPITIMVGFFILTVLLPVMANFFTNSFTAAFTKIENLLAQIKVAPL